MTKQATGEDHTEASSLCFSPDIVQVIRSSTVRWLVHVACMGESRRAYRILVEKLEEKTPLRRPRCRWDYNNRMGLKKSDWECMDRIDLAQDRNK